MQIFQVFDHLLQTGADGITVIAWVAAVKCIENDGFVGILFLKVALHHGQFV